MFTKFGDRWSKNQRIIGLIGKRRTEAVPRRPRHRINLLSKIQERPIYIEVFALKVEPRTLPVWSHGKEKHLSRPENLRKGVYYSIRNSTLKENKLKLLPASLAGQLSSFVLNEGLNFQRLSLISIVKWKEGEVCTIFWSHLVAHRVHQELVHLFLLQQVQGFIFGPQN